MKSRKPNLSRKNIQKEVFKRLKKYEKMNLLEQYAMFMDSAQIFELRLKQLLSRQFDISIEDSERWTLGTVVRKLQTLGLRSDFTGLLDSIVEYRNFIAHELLAREIMFRSLLNGKTTRHASSMLYKGLYELEQINILFDWVDKDHSWGDLAA